MTSAFVEAYDDLPPAVLVCPPLMRHYLIYTCRTFIFTTATPRYNIFNIECVLDYMESEKGRQVSQS